MRLRVRVAGLAFCAAALLVPAACGRKGRERRSHTVASQPTIAPPTPDTTPVEALRTPAGLALKVSPPSGTPTPQAPPAGAAAKSPL